jgi:hypothetical protein
VEPALEPLEEVAGDDDSYYCQCEGCDISNPMTYEEIIDHFLDHGKLEIRKITECRWSGCVSQGKFPMGRRGFFRHVRETQKHHGLLKMVPCEKCNKEKESRSIRKHCTVCSGTSKNGKGRSYVYAELAVVELLFSGIFMAR